MIGRTLAANWSAALTAALASAAASVGLRLPRRTPRAVRTFALLTTSANELVGRIHDPMPAILKPEDHERWLAISPRVNSPKNDDEDLLVGRPWAAINW
jgi:putative SOS response-associated peptidase YedK